MSKRIVITGIGPIASVGIGKEDFWKGIINKNTNVELAKSHAGDEIWDEYYVHKVQKFDIHNFGINEDDLEYIEDWKESPIDMDMQYMLAAVKLAFDDGKIDYKKAGKDSVGLIVTNENLGMEDFCNKILNESYKKMRDSTGISEKAFSDDVYYKIVKNGYEVQTFMPLFHVARTFNIHKYSLFVNNACASGLYAIEAASDMIKLNKTPVVVVCASDHSNVYKHLWFKMINMYEPDGKMKPYSSKSKGLVMGEGASALILEDYDHAKKRGAHIYAEYLGGGFRLEGWKITIPQVGGTSYQEAIEDALTASKTSKEGIDLICGHAPSTMAADAYEAQAISSVFGDSNISVTAFKPYVGHTLGASTLVELAILLLAMENDFVPPVLNTKEIDSRFKIDLIKDKRKLKIKTVMKLCCAFAGFNAASIFRKA